MSTPANPSQSEFDRVKARSQLVLEHQVERLAELAEIGMQIARDIGRKVAEAAAAPATCDEHQPSAHDLALAFERAARGVRVTFLLQAKALESLGDLSLRGSDCDPVSPRPIDENRPARVAGIVRRLAETKHAGDKPQIDRLMGLCAERLDREGLSGALAHRPLAQLVARICRDLGLDPDWADPEIWSQAWDWDEEVAEAAEPSVDPDPPRYSGLTERQMLNQALTDLKAYAPSG